MNFDLNKKYCYYFNEICKIPHGSYNEKAISDYVVNFAKENHLEYIQDEMNNVIIRKPATKGYEDYDSIMLQGHLDMVCEAEPNMSFDFLHQPIETYVDDKGNLRAKGTTLGADDGMGVAEMLAILIDDTIQHPELECVFTVQEEVGLFGALGLDKSLLKSHRMISLDGGGETVTSISSAGGVNVVTSIPVSHLENDLPCYEMKVTGFSGGHSGGEIHKEKGNANKIAARILKGLLNEGVKFDLVSIQGGQKINAICRECVAVIATEAKDLQQKVEELYKKIYVEFAYTDPGFKVECKLTTKANTSMDETSTNKVIDFLFVVPNGFQHKSMEIEGLTLTSLNLGILETKENEVVSTSSVRSALEEAIDDLVDQITTLSSFIGASTTTNARYPGWTYDPHSKMRETFKEVVKELYDNKELECQAGHGGLECAVFTSVPGGMDIITCGPIAGACHTPDEYLNLESWDRTYTLLTTLLSKVTKEA